VKNSPSRCKAARTMPWRAATAGKSKAPAKQAFLSHSNLPTKTQAAMRI
jgi:hypothetical protein